jgi:hypothetical protein
MLMPLKRWSSSSSSPRGGTGIGKSRSVNVGDVGHHEATREDGEDVTAVFAVGGHGIYTNLYNMYITLYSVQVT